MLKTFYLRKPRKESINILWSKEIFWNKTENQILSAFEIYFCLICGRIVWILSKSDNSLWLFRKAFKSGLVASAFTIKTPNSFLKSSAYLHKNRFINYPIVFLVSMQSIWFIISQKGRYLKRFALLMTIDIQAHKTSFYNHKISWVINTRNKRTCK